MHEKILVFDLGGVLINLKVDRCISRFRQLMGDANMQSVLGLGADGEGIASVSVANRQLMADFERGNISSERFVCEVLRSCPSGTTAEDVIEVWHSMLDELPQARLDYLQKLKQDGYRMYLLSNGNDLHFNRINGTYHLDRYFERLFLSQEMHLAKPQKELFEAVDSAINGQHQQVIFVDDLAANREAAERFVHWTTCADLEELKAIIEKNVENTQ